MDVVLHFADAWLLDSLYARLIPAPSCLPHTIPPPSLPPLSANCSSSHPPNILSTSASSNALSAWPQDYMPRQLLSLLVITFIGIHLIYFIFAGLSYFVIFNHEMMKHPRFLKNQVAQEIKTSLKSFPWMVLLTLPWFVGEVRGYSMLYEHVDEYGWPYFFFSIAFFFVITDYFVYWIHRLEHHPAVYKHVHKLHHKWIVPTPWAAYAFHPLDSYLQSLPYHLFVYVFPFNKYLHMGLFIWVNIWTILIHDSDMITGHWLETIINGPAHHTLHHLYFTVNYGQYFTWADKMNDSYRQPEQALDPMLEIHASQAAKETESPGKSQ